MLVTVLLGKLRSLNKKSIKSIKSEISVGDLQKPFREFKNRKFLLVSKCCHSIVHLVILF